MNLSLALIASITITVVSSIPAITDSNAISVENDNDVCEGMCHANYSDILEECQYGCHHRSGIRKRINPFRSCFGACSSRYHLKLDEARNDTSFIDRAFAACYHACKMPYKTKIKWNVYIDLRSGEPIWNFERIISNGHQISSEALQYDDLISTVALRKSHFFMDPSSKLRFPNMNVYEADSRAMQAIMMEMLEKVRHEISSIAPPRFDGISSIDYIGPRIVEYGPNGPIVNDITEIEYRPKDSLIDHNINYREQQAMFAYFVLIFLSFVAICGCVKLRRRYAAYKATRSSCEQIHHPEESDDWTKKIPTTGEAPPCYSPPEKKNLVKQITLSK